MAAVLSDNLTITSVQARSAIRVAFRVKRPVFLWGPPGIGKSEIVTDLATEMGGVCVDLRMAQMEPTDIRGIPFFNKDNGKMDWAPPIDLPDEEFASQYPIVVLFLDEMNSAPPAVQAAGYQLILNRRVGKYVLPDNVVIVAAGNRDSDKGVTYRMPMPLSNRFLHLEMRSDFNSWQAWAVNKLFVVRKTGHVRFRC
jgi:MoxR-like ATPase